MVPGSGESIDIPVEVKSKRPTDSAFKQQRLPAWQPVLTAGTVLPTFFVIGIAFIPIGVALLYFSDAVREMVIDYTDCVNDKNETCASVIAKNWNETCHCNIMFELKRDFQGKVFMYYGLTNYYQNHRRYVKSRDDEQLLGKLGLPSSDCVPFAFAEDPVTHRRMPIAPCGAIANSLFNDTLRISRFQDKAALVPLLNTGIAWPSDKEIKFRNPPGDLRDMLSDFAKPLNWQRELWELDQDNPSNNGFQNEDLIVWMRTAALPNFRKLYRRVDHSQKFYENGMLKGLFELQVIYSYPVSSFNGRKLMILSTTSWLGGKNPFLGSAYIAVGCICLVLGILLLLIHIRCSKNTTEMINVNPSTSYS